MSCKECQDNAVQVQHMTAMMVEVKSHISGLKEQLRIASDQPYKYSEAFTIGGPQGPYRFRSPYNGQVQFRIDSISGTGAASGYTILVSPDLNAIVPAFTASDVGTTELSCIRGLLYIGTNGITVPVDSSWYDLTDQSNILYMQITTTLAAYAIVQFRQKR